MRLQKAYAVRNSFWWGNMRILWLNHRDPLNPESGGAEVRIQQIGKRLVSKGFTIELVCERWRGGPKSDYIDGIKVKRFGGRFGVYLGALLSLGVKRNYDVVIDDIAHAVPWGSPLFTKKPVICQIHHLHRNILRFELSPFLASLASLSERLVPLLYTRIIAVSESTKYALNEQFNIPFSRIVVIPNGVDSNSFRFIKKTKNPTILWVGRIKYYKRVSDLLSAFKLVKAKISNAELLIVGDGDYVEQVKEKSRNIGLRNVVFTGRIGEKEKIQLMKTSWTIVGTSMVEGWGMTIIEAAACGTPAIGYNVAGLRDSIQDGKTGILVENGNISELSKALIFVLENENLRIDLGKNAFKRAKEFSWDKTAEHFIKVLKGITDD